VQRSKERFPLAFSYGKTLYKDARTLINLTCLKHGDFEVLPHVHLRLNSAGGCPKCSRNSLKSIDEFIADAHKLHGEAYDYSATVYVSAKAKVSIICRAHGPFLQEASSHLSGAGCPKCWGEKKANIHAQTLELRHRTFLEKAVEIHKDVYDYSGAFYKNHNSPLQIICKTHGPFFQRPAVHLRGGGCPTCAAKLIGRARRSSTERFVCQANVVHDNYFDYSSVLYKTTHEPVVIICPDHGPFEQRPSNHLQGAGCPICAGLHRGQERKEFRALNLLEDFQAAHGDRYDYSRVVYVDSRTKVEIRCPAHDKFFVTPANHLQGIRCKECALENRPDYVDARVHNDPEYAAREGFVYLLRVTHPLREGYFYKIGITSREHPRLRFRYARYERFSIEVIAFKQGTMREVWEHEKMVKHQIKERNALIPPFCGDYWHWTESFQDVNQALSVSTALIEEDRPSMIEL
jgi:hypothetical protein